ncbi:class I SAM-dependent methyltransferase [Maribacter sp. 4G9]|uniref:class I SAM-dependent methyltransferase n=1 Tax=Maribacter sp. 4G9 TaxID=1889777 RepID=UPI000C147591|nr:class I SAM-dependent methyltransferase [Maribacter sp. 4G9]PIB39396.1 methyltransferase [Maribacter sp. 4G9]
MIEYIKTKDHFNTQEIFVLEYIEALDLLKTSPSPKNLEKYYAHQDYISHTDNNKTKIDKIYQKVKNYSLIKKVQLINKLDVKEKRILDIGAGTGDFLKIASKDKWKIEGVEPNQYARQKASEKNIVLQERIEKLKNEKFDVITLWHVLEHLPDLENQVKKINNLLTERGYLIIAAPNYKSYDAHYYKDYWAAFDTPRHLWHFSKKSIQLLFIEHNIKLIKTKPMLFDSFYVSLLSEKYKTGKNNYMKAFLIGLISNIKGLFTKEYSSHIYILQKIK